MFLIDGLLHSVEGYSDGDLGASAGRGLQAQRSAEFAGALFHYGYTEMSAARGRPQPTAAMLSFTSGAAIA